MKTTRVLCYHQLEEEKDPLFLLPTILQAFSANAVSGMKVIYNSNLQYRSEGRGVRVSGLIPSLSTLFIQRKKAVPFEIKQ